MFYLIGLGLGLKSISLEALEIIKKAKKVYLENYTIELEYGADELEKEIGSRIIPLTRIMVESEEFVAEAKSKDIVLLVYGSPLAATTHISLILKCKKEGIKYKIIQNASIFDAISETGLQLYKMGRTASMPAWTDKYKPDSFADIIKNNRKIEAHTLILVDIGLKFGDALKQLEEACSNKKMSLGKIVVCSRMGADSRIYYSHSADLAGREVYAPFCFIIPARLHFIEQEALELLSE